MAFWNSSGGTKQVSDIPDEGGRELQKHTCEIFVYGVGLSLCTIMLHMDINKVNPTSPISVSILNIDRLKDLYHLHTVHLDWSFFGI